MKIVQLVIAAFLISFLVACDRSTGYVKTTVEPTSVITSSVVEAKTPGVRTATATRRPTNKPPILIDETSDVPATPTSTPTTDPPPPPSTPVPEPLNQTGPWLMLSQRTFYSGPLPYLDPVFINADGSGWQLANIPRDPFLPLDEPDALFGSIASKGPYAAFYGYMTEYQPSCPKDGPGFFSLTGSLYILKLPENKVVYEFKMFGEEAKEQFHKEECNFVNQGRFDTPPVMGVTSNQAILHWSPDGRYLAFPAAPVGKAADLYLYDTQTNNIRRLTTRQNNPDILGWSPDGQAIIYRSITRMDLFKLQFLESDGLYSVSVSGGDRLLFTPEVIPLGLKWLSKTQFLISDGKCDPWGSGLCTTHLRLVDLSTGTNEVIYSNPNMLVYYSTDPVHHLLLFNNPPADMIKAIGTTVTPVSQGEEVELLKGIYQYNFKTHSIELVLAGNVPYLFWDPIIQAFRFEIREEAPPRTSSTPVLRYTFEKGFIVDHEGAGDDLSPDGLWKVIYSASQGKFYIQDTEGRNIQAVADGSSCGWSPNSSAYIQLVRRTGTQEFWLTVYLKENNWRPVITRRIKENNPSCEWITP